MLRRILAAAALSAATLVLAETPRTFDFGKESLVAIQDAPATMPRRLFPALSEADFAALSGWGRGARLRHCLPVAA